MEIILPQMIAAGIYNAQLANKNRTVSANRRTTMFEIELPIEAGGISYVDDSLHRIQTDTLICAKPNQIRHTRLPFKCYYIHFILSGGVLYEMLQEMPTYLRTEDREKYASLFEKLCECFDSGLEFEHVRLQSLLLELIYTLHSDARRCDVKSSVRTSGADVIERTVEYIDLNLVGDLSLEAVSNHIGLSAIHFHNRFKAATGRTLHQYVEEQRIKKAMNLLAATDKTLTEIAYECGFSSQSYFSYAFKKRVKSTPREYAKQAALRYASDAEQQKRYLSR
jgi:AraC-like DNA-binding protein